MEGHEEAQDPLWFHEFTGNEIVYDIIYTPVRTALLKRAEAAGCAVLNGWPMFEQQALLQSELFRGLFAGVAD
jgi:3-dehydroquinate dehydratase/shikimate dehydrogenase